MLTTLALLPLLLPGQEGTRPNVLLVIVDDLNDWVGALGGHPQARTPNIDALAARGVSFTNAHCQAPVCTPSRASLFTGRLPSTTGMYFLQPALAQARELDGVTTLVERFAAEGYDTLGVGKLHHGSGEARFFKEYGGGMGGFGPMPPEKLSYPLGHPLWDWGPYPETDALMPDSKVADWAVAKLGEERDEPFFLAVGFWRPHVPMYVPEPWFEAIGREEDVRLPDVLTTDRDDLSRYAKELTIGLPAPRHEWMVEHDAWRGAVHAYLASSSFVDARVGRVLRALEESPHADDTIVVLLSDHGFHLGEKQRWAKRSLWEESTRVPLIIAGPGIAAANCDAPVGLVDLYPTLLELCGLEPSEGLDGNSLLGLVREPTVSWPHAAITSFGPGNHAVRTRGWRYIRYADGSEELYDHEVDPREWHNLASQDGRSDVLAELRAFLPKHDADPVAGTAGAGFEAMHAAEAATGQADEHRAALERPTNFLVILADDLGFSDVGCYGGEIETPNLDALAAGGLRFTQFYNSGRCWPTRAALMTGYYAQQVRRDKLPGVRSGGGGVRPSWARLLPEMLRPSGYRTYHSGKWHIDGQVLENGFDRSYRLNDHDHFFNPRDHTEDDEGLPPVESGTGYYATSAIADHAIRCLQDHAAEHADKPFFQFLAFTTPHFPLHALPEDIARYRDAYLRDWQAVREERSLRQKESGLLDARLSEVERDVGPPYHFAEAMDALGPGEVNRPLPWEELTAEEQRFQATKMAIHAAMVDRMDRDIGRVLEQLREMDAYDDTLILFLSDNGASAEIMVRGDGHDRAAAPGSAKSYLCLGPGWSNVANTPFRRHKTWVHEGGIATPMIAHWPRGIAARGEFRRTPGHVIDVVPTILELAGAQPPTTLDGTSLPSAPGKSLVPALAADVQVERDHLWWSHEGHRALRIGDWKLVAASGDAWELFDLSTDRAETSDLAAAHPERVARMAELWKTRENEFLELVRD